MVRGDSLLPYLSSGMGNARMRGHRRQEELPSHPSPLPIAPISAVPKAGSLRVQQAEGGSPLHAQPSALWGG